MAWNVLILGGGFRGLTAARKLERLLPPASARITVINDGEVERLTYDQLVVTLGSTSRSLPIPGRNEHAMGLETLRLEEQSAGGTAPDGGVAVDAPPARAT